MSIEHDLPAVSPTEIRNLEYWLDRYTWEGAQPKPSRVQAVGEKAVQFFETFGSSIITCSPYLSPFL